MFLPVVEIESGSVGLVDARSKAPNARARRLLNFGRDEVSIEAFMRRKRLAERRKVPEK